MIMILNTGKSYHLTTTKLKGRDTFSLIYLIFHLMKSKNEHYLNIHNVNRFII